jgi:hypothetical protein
VGVVDTGVTAVAHDAHACALCAANASAAHEHAPAKRDRRDELLPWAAALTVGVLIASFGAGGDRWFGVGAIIGILAGATFASQGLRRALAERDAMHGAEVKALNTEADDRVAMVIRQFEWAVNDLSKLKRDQDRAQVTADLLVVQGRARERHIRKLERELAEARRHEEPAAAIEAPRAEFDTTAEVVGVRFSWGLHFDGSTLRLELECDTATRATRVRLVDKFGMTILKSLTPMHTGNGSLSFALVDPPADLIEDLESCREITYRMEALCDYEWRPMQLEDSRRRTKIVTDRQGRQFRVTSPDMTTTTPNPFDHTSDAAFFTL